jgi:large subunit ribosomal protein L31
MKDKIHPQYGNVLFTCASCSSQFVTTSTRLDGAKKEYQGKEYPGMTLEICSQCHPFFSGKQIYVDTAGRVEKFQRRYGSLTGVKPDAAAAKKAEPQQAQAKAKEAPRAAVAAPAEPKKPPAPRPPKPSPGKPKVEPAKAEGKPATE